MEGIKTTAPTRKTQVSAVKFTGKSLPEGAELRHKSDKHKKVPLQKTASLRKNRMADQSSPFSAIFIARTLTDRPKRLMKPSASW